ncbi:MAG: ATP-binding protein, partial [Chloroflexota bacterium]
TEENAGVVVHICKRLDGIPLAIELAAARVAGLPLETIAARLDQSIRMLTSGPRDVLPRHQTLHAALDWSWTLLDEQEQALLRRLSVFAGGWRLGAAVAVCAGNGIADWAVPDLLERLINKSLVSLDERDAAAHHRLLEIVRQFATERLAEGGEQAATRDRHLDWCVALAEEAAGKLKGPEQGVWLDRLEREHDNLRAALDWSLRDQGDAALGLRLAGVLWRFWLTRGYPSEGRIWLEEALARSEQDPGPMRARALEGAGSLAYAQGDYPRAVALNEDALALNRVLEDSRGVAAALNNLGNVAFQQDEYERAMALHGESLALRRSLGDTWGIAASLGNLGHVADLQGDFGRAAALFGEALALQRSLGDTWGIATSLNNLGLVTERQGEYGRAAAQIEESLALFQALGNTYGIARALDSRGDVAYQQGDYLRAAALHAESLPLRRALGDTQGIAASLSGAGQVAYQQGEYERATDLFEEALALRRALGDTWGIAASLNQLGQVAERRGDYGRAVALVEESLRLSREIGARNLLGESLESMAWLAAACGRQQRAARLGGAAETAREALGIPLPPGRRAGHDRATRAMRLALGEEGFAANWADGRALPLDEAIAMALLPPMLGPHP